MPKVYVLYSGESGGGGQGGDTCEEEEWSCRNWTEYACLACFFWILVIAILVVMFIWLVSNREGFGFSKDNPEKLCNVHIIITTMGFVLFEAIAITLFRICRCCRRRNLKVAHAILHALAIPCLLLGWYTVHQYSNEKKNNRIYTAHAWIGLFAILFYVVQFLIGAFTFLGLTLCNRATAPFREDMIPLHASFGILNFAFNVIAVCTGIQEKVFTETGLRSKLIVKMKVLHTTNKTYLLYNLNEAFDQFCSVTKPLDITLKSNTLEQKYFQKLPPQKQCACVDVEKPDNHLSTNYVDLVSLIEVAKCNKTPNSLLKDDEIQLKRCASQLCFRSKAYKVVLKKLQSKSVRSKNNIAETQTINKNQIKIFDDDICTDADHTLRVHESKHFVRTIHSEQEIEALNHASLKVIGSVLSATTSISLTLKQSNKSTQFSNTSSNDENSTVSNMTNDSLDDGHTLLLNNRVICSSSLYKFFHGPRTKSQKSSIPVFERDTYVRPLSVTYYASEEELMSIDANDF
ncbi:hypothetical protein FQR65_LT01565 [Abscondita terminalis]|nr:hypothetical protein FQR65_LT01565 [Abscondita terminalis]